MDKKHFEQKFKQHFNGQPRVFQAPGRVNLIGEHTDYNDGYVFPMAINRYTTVAVSPRADRRLELWSENMGEAASVDLDRFERKAGWSDYVAGIASMLEREGFRLPGADLYIESDVPVGSGLSSSAAIEISTALALLSTVNGTMDGAALAKLGQRAENSFVGMNCGIMDQFISVHAKAHHAMLLDCRSLDYELVPLRAEHLRVVICNTMVKHELGASEYNKRRAECEEGVRIIQADFPKIVALRDLSLSQFDGVSYKLPEVVRKRCRHVISEDERVLQSVSALKGDKYELFGKLMNASHDSLREDYQVSCEELDLMVDIARRVDGVLGARMTGGGFGGCTVNLVESAKKDDFCFTVKEKYKSSTGLDPTIYVSTPADGAHEMDG